MNLPKLNAYLSTSYNEKTNQHEVIVEHITATSRIKILDHNQLPIEDLQNITFHIEDKNNLNFNTNTLDKLFDLSSNESKEFFSELLDGKEAVPPFKFVLNSKCLDLSKLDFQISWKNI